MYVYDCPKLHVSIPQIYTYLQYATFQPSTSEIEKIPVLVSIAWPCPLGNFSCQQFLPQVVGTYGRTLRVSLYTCLMCITRECLHLGHVSHRTKRCVGLNPRVREEEIAA